MNVRQVCMRSLNRIQTKLLLAFLLTTVVIIAVNLYVYGNINRILAGFERVYASNASLNDMQNSLGRIQIDLTEYLNSKSPSALEDYYRDSDKYRGMLESLNDQIVDDANLLSEKNIRNMSVSYLEGTDRAISYRRARNVEGYKNAYEQATRLHNYILSIIYTLNNERFRENSNSYATLVEICRRVEMLDIVILCLSGLLNVFLITLLTRQITSPLKDLAGAADRIAGGDLDAPPVPVTTHDEIARVSVAFNQMAASIRQHIERLRLSMEAERQMQEKELLMETHLKDAQLKYLQAQINPHFLFNTLNAGAQLAMMEDADRTYEYIQHVADFFRYNVKKDFESVTLREEIELVDHYIYILNVRFGGEIHFEKQIDASLLDTQIPAMTLQPIVENSVNHGIRGIEREGRILLRIYKEVDAVCISIADNGVGMDEKLISQLLDGKTPERAGEKNSNGVAFTNVVRRLQLFLGKEDVVDIISEGKDLGTEVVLYLPFMGA
ncbi:MAG: HAMP domain-containing protein [Lachnospiraceae bacterium]|nr:HAMP domain-containing protein [Lachnospiraceae bacterium]